MRIWHQSYSDLRELPGYVSWLTRHADSVLPGVVVDVHGSRPVDDEAMTPERKAAALLAAAWTAEREGYDAFTLGCTYDPALVACRASVSIPVLALAESAVRLGVICGQPLGLLVLAYEEIDIVGSLMAEYGLGRDEVVVLVVTPAVSEPELDALGRGGRWHVSEAAEKAAAKLRADGVKTVIAAEGVLNEYLWVASKAGLSCSIGDSIGWLWREARATIEQQVWRPARQSEAALVAPAEDGHVEWFRAAP